MFRRMRPVLSGLLFAAALSATLPAAQGVLDDGLIDVTVGDVKVLEDVKVPVGARVAANLCGVRVDAVLERGVAVDRSSTAATVCTANAGSVRLEQN